MRKFVKCLAKGLVFCSFFVRDLFWRKCSYAWEEGEGARQLVDTPQAAEGLISGWGGGEAV